MGKDLNGKELGPGFTQIANKSYHARYTDRFGKRHSLYNKNLKLLREELRKRQYEDANCLNIIDNGITLNDWFTKWLTVYKADSIRLSTKSIYMTIYKKHIAPKLGSLKLLDITQFQIKALINEIKAKGIKFETQNKSRILLLDMFDKAVINDFAKKNPVRGIKIERDEKFERRVLTREEQVEFFDCCKGTFYDNLFVVAVTTELRPGEICALTWDDIDLEKNEISVTKTLLYQKLEGDTKRTFHIHPPKTKSSERKVPINKQCLLALKKQKMLKNVVKGKYDKALEGFEDLLFITRYNTPINDETYKDAIKKIINEVNLCRDVVEFFESFSPHTFRHTFATRCFEAGMSPKTIQTLLGHATLEMTTNLYMHVLKEHKEKEMIKYEQNFDLIAASSDYYVEEKFKRFERDEENKNKVIDFGLKK